MPFSRMAIRRIRFSKRRENPASKMDNPRIENYLAAITRSYWILLGLCAAAIVVSTGRDEAMRYKLAVDELRSIGRLSAGIDHIYRKVGDYLRPGIVPLLVESLRAAAKIEGVTVDETSVLENFNYFHVDRGPLTISFSANPSELPTSIEEFFKASSYIAKIPRIESAGLSLSNTIRGVLKGIGPTDKTVVSLDFSCNYAYNQCRGELALRLKNSGAMPERKEFYIDAQSLTIPLVPFNVLGFAQESDARAALSMTSLATLSGELAGKDTSAAFGYLAAKINEKEGTIKVFDFSFSGIAAFYALPIGIMMSLGWLLMHLRELAALNVSRQKIVSQGAEFFYARRTNSIVVQGVILFAPIVSQLMIARVAMGTNPWVSGFIGAMAFTSAVLSVLILLQRREMMKIG